MFTLGTIGCPDCSTNLAVLDFTASEDGMRATALLSCQNCRRRLELVATLTVAADPKKPPAPKRERFQEAEPGPTGDSEAEALAADLTHVLTPFVATQHRAEDGTYPCPACPARLANAQGLAAHHRQHDVKVPCPRGCGKMLNPSAGLSKHLNRGPCTTTPSQEDPPPCPPDEPLPAEPAAPTSSSSTTSGGTATDGEATPSTASPGTSTSPPSSSSAAPAKATSAPTTTAQTAGTPETTSPAAAPPTAPSPMKARTMSSRATEAAKASASRRVAAQQTRTGSTTSDAAADPPAAPPLRGRASWSCGFLYSEAAGLCGITKLDSDKGWKRARLPGGAHVDLCPDHRDATPAELRASAEFATA